VIQSIEHEQEFFETFLNGGVRLGHVYAGSGVNRVYTHRNKDKQLFDWALILVLRERLPASEAVANQNKASLRSFLCYRYSNS